MLLALLCIALIISTATVELTHHHADGEHSDCSLCVTAHVVIQAVAGPAFVVLFTRIAAVILAARLLVIEKQTIFALFTRPPPTYLTAA